MSSPDEPREGDEPAADRAEPVDPAAAVEVIEPPIPDRVRRPADAVRLAVVALVLVVGFVFADLAVGTRGAVEQDLAEATSGLPRILLTLLAWLSGLGAVLLPIAVGAMVYGTSPDYIELLWTTTRGRLWMAGGIFMMVMGTFVMKKMISFDI